MKILYVISTFGGGGAESQLFTFCEHLQKQTNVSFSVLALKSGGSIEIRFKEAGINYDICGNSSFLKNVRAVHKIIKKEKYDIVHAHMLYSDIVCRLAITGTKTKLVSTHHGLGKWKKKWLLFLDKITKWKVSHFIMVSQESYKIRVKREKYPPKKMSVVFNGIDSNIISKSPKTIGKDKIVFGCVARFTQNKQINYLVNILNELRDDKRFCLELVGEGEEKDKVEEMVNSMHLSDRVVFHGWSNSVIDIISQWNFFVLCSINEDLPVSLLESMARGLVPIASRVGGIPDVLQNGKLGYLCNSSSFLDYLQGINYYTNDPVLYSSTSANCEKFIEENFSINKSVEKTIDIYNKILKEL